MSSLKQRIAELLRGHPRYTLEGVTEPYVIDLIESMIVACNIIREQQQLLDKAIEGLEVIATPLYPEKIFTPLTGEDWQAIKDCCAGRGFVLDRLSGEYGRMFTRELNHIAVQTLTDIKQAYDGGEDE